MSTQKRGRRIRGYILTERGIAKLKKAIDNYSKLEGHTRRISRAKIAEIVGVCESTVARATKGKNIDEDTLFAFMAEFKVELEEGPDYHRPILEDDSVNDTQELLTRIIELVSAGKEILILVTDRELGIEQKLLTLESNYHFSSLIQQNAIVPLIQEYQSPEFLIHLQHESKIGESSVASVREFVTENGGYDQDALCSKYSLISREWNYLLNVLGWCQANHRYDDIVYIWRHLNVYASLNGHWLERCYWLDVIIRESKSRGNWPTCINAMAEKSYTLMSMGKFIEAEDLLIEAASLKPNDLVNQTNLMKQRAALACYQKDYSMAYDYITKAKGKLEIAEMEEDIKKRYELALMFVEGRILYDKGDKEKAQEEYEYVFDQCGQINWPRKANHSQFWLAKIFVDNNQLDDAEQLIARGSQQAKSNFHRPLELSYKKAELTLKVQKGHLEDACEAAEQLIKAFSILHMEPEVKEMEQLLGRIQQMGENMRIRKKDEIIVPSSH